MRIRYLSFEQDVHAPDGAAHRAGKISCCLEASPTAPSRWPFSVTCKSAYTQPVEVEMKIKIVYKQAQLTCSYSFSEKRTLLALDDCSTFKLDAQSVPLGWPEMNDMSTESVRVFVQAKREEPQKPEPKYVASIFLPHWAVSLWVEKTFADIQAIACDGEAFPCHKAVLAGASPVLRCSLSTDFQEAASVQFRDIDAAVLELMLQWVYLEELPKDVCHSKLLELLRVADMYDLPNLLEECATRLEKLVSKDNVLETLHYLQRLPAQPNQPIDELLYVVESFVKDNDDVIHLVCMNARPAFSNKRVESCSWVVEAVAEHLDCNSNGIQTRVPGSSTVPESLPLEDRVPGNDLSTLDSSAFTHEPVSEQPAIISEEEAAAVAHERWASSVEARIVQDGEEQMGIVSESPNVCTWSQQNNTDSTDFVDVEILHFHRHPKALGDAVRRSQLGQELTSAGVEMEPGWAGGAKVLVQGMSAAMLESCGVPPASLRPSHVIVNKDNVSKILDKIQTLPYHVRPRTKAAHCRSIRLPSCNGHICVQAVNERGEGIAVHASADSYEAALPFAENESLMDSQPDTIDLDPDSVVFWRPDDITLCADSDIGFA